MDRERVERAAQRMYRHELEAFYVNQTMGATTMPEEAKPFVFSDLQEKWLQALESGEWKQNNDCVLRSDNGHCCLGVAAECFGLRWSEKRKAFIFKGDELGAYLSLDAHIPFGLRDEHGVFVQSVPAKAGSSYASYGSLVDMNDGGMTFSEIAAYIRANPRNVFVEPSPCSPQ